MEEEPHPIQFGAFTVDPADRRLSGPSGPIHIGGRAFDVLWALLKADGRLVSKDQLFADVWQGLAVSDAALTSVIRELRIALGDQGKDGMIRAVYGKGYRLEVNSLVQRKNIPSSSSPRVGEPGPKLAVLPFDDLSPHGDMAYFADGISEEILSTIIRGSDIRTISRLSSFAFRGRDKQRAPTELRATHILDGSVRRSGDQVRITAHLLEENSGETVWSDSFDGASTDVFETQAKIAEAIANKLVGRFTPQQRHKIAPPLYDLFLRAKSLASAHDQQSTAKALMERVTSEAPDFAPGWGLLAVSIAHFRMVRPIAEWPALIEQSRNAIANARHLDASEPLALWAEYRLCNPYGDYEKQLSILESLKYSMGNTSEYHFMESWFHCLVGRFGEAIDKARLSRELNPVANVGSEYYGECLYYAGRLEEARAVMLSDLDEAPENRYLAATLALCAARLGDRKLVDELLDPARLARYPLGDLEFQGVIARIELDHDARIYGQVAEQIRQQCIASNCIDTLSAVGLSRYGSPSECHDLISSLPIGPTGQGASDFFATASSFLLLKDWPDVRSDPRFATLCARLGLARYWLDHSVWPDCADEDGLGYDFHEEVTRAADVIQPETINLPSA